MNLAGRFRVKYCSIIAMDLANGLAILLLAFPSEQKFTATTMTRE